MKNVIGTRVLWSMLLFACAWTVFWEGSRVSFDRKFQLQMEETRTLYEADKMKDIDRFTARCRDVALYERLSICEYMVARFVTTNACPPILEGEERDEQHDLGVEIGRTAFAVARVMNTIIDPPARIINQADLDTYREHIRLALKERKNEEVREELARHPVDLVKLEAEFKDKITPGTRNDAVRSASWMAGLFLEWFPIGRSVEDLERIVGHPPSLVTTQGVVYCFNDGEFPLYYAIYVTSNRIDAVLSGRGYRPVGW